MQSADVLRFPSLGSTGRLRKVRLRSETLAGVQRLIALAPVLGRCNPTGIPTVEHVMMNLIGEPPNGGLEREELQARPATAAHTASSPRRQRRAPRATALVTTWTDGFVPAVNRRGVTRRIA